MFRDKKRSPTPPARGMRRRFFVAGNSEGMTLRLGPSLVLTVKTMLRLDLSIADGAESNVGGRAGRNCASPADLSSSHSSDICRLRLSGLQPALPISALPGVALVKRGPRAAQP